MSHVQPLSGFLSRARAHVASTLSPDSAVSAVRSPEPAYVSKIPVPRAELTPTDGSTTDGDSVYDIGIEDTYGLAYPTIYQRNVEQQQQPHQLQIQHLSGSQHEVLSDSTKHSMTRSMRHIDSAARGSAAVDESLQDTSSAMAASARRVDSVARAVADALHRSSTRSSHRSRDSPKSHASDAESVRAALQALASSSPSSRAARQRGSAGSSPLPDMNATRALWSDTHEAGAESKSSSPNADANVSLRATAGLRGRVQQPPRSGRKDDEWSAPAHSVASSDQSMQDLYSAVAKHRIASGSGGSGHGTAGAEADRAAGSQYPADLWAGQSVSSHVSSGGASSADIWASVLQGFGATELLPEGSAHHAAHKGVTHDSKHGEDEQEFPQGADYNGEVPMSEELREATRRLQEFSAEQQAAGRHAGGADAATADSSSSSSSSSEAWAPVSTPMLGQSQGTPKTPAGMPARPAAPQPPSVASGESGSEGSWFAGAQEHAGEAAAGHQSDCVDCLSASGSESSDAESLDEYLHTSTGRTPGDAAMQRSSARVSRLRAPSAGSSTASDEHWARMSGRPAPAASPTERLLYAWKHGQEVGSDMAGEADGGLAPRTAWVAGPEPHYMLYNVRTEGLGPLSRRTHRESGTRAGRPLRVPEQGRGADVSSRVASSSAKHRHGVTFAQYRSMRRTAEAMYIALMGHDGRTSEQVPAHGTAKHRTMAALRKRAAGRRNRKPRQNQAQREAGQALAAALADVEDPLVHGAPQVPLPSQPSAATLPSTVAELLNADLPAQPLVEPAGEPGTERTFPLPVHTLRELPSSEKARAALAPGLAALLVDVCESIGVDDVSNMLPRLRQLTSSALTAAPFRNFSHRVCEAVGAAAANPSLEEHGQAPCATLGLAECMTVLREQLRDRAAMKRMHRIVAHPAVREVDHPFAGDREVQW